ncbi:MAG: acyl-CoA/acyl-ACP dehydrogenase [Burkholderiales bacterium]|nr:acyl-CoA/acyl-ACP dehydrogenase [Burkholderiales bacterium]
MQLDWTEEQKALRARYQHLGERFNARRGNSLDQFDEAGWKTLCSEGMWKLVIPESYGGSGADWWAFTAALEGLSTTIRAPALLLSIIAQAGMVRALNLYGSEAQKDRYFAAILRGDLSATAIAEPTTGTDVRSIETTIRSHGEGYELNGQKFNIAHAPVADFILVVTRIADLEKKNTTLVLLDRGQQGVTYGQPDNKLGMRDLPTGSLGFDSVKIKPSQVLGVPGEGLHDLIDIISLGRLYYGLVAANVITPFLTDALAYSRSRRSFKLAIDTNQYIQKRLIDIKIGMERSKWLAYAALSQLLNGHPDALMMCSIAKLVGSEDLINSALSLIRLHGSVGYHEGGVTALARDALGFSSVGGTEEMHRKNIFNQMSRQSV